MTRQELIDALEQAEGPSYALDLAIAQTLVPEIVVLRRNNDDTDNVPHTYRKFSASVDDAIWLVQTLLPGWTWKVGTCCVSDDAWVAPDFNCPVHGERLKRELSYDTIKVGSIWDAGADIDLRPSGRPAIALCIAVLSVLEAKEATSHE